MAWLRRLFNTFRPSRMQREIEREMAFHLAERADQLRAEGLSEAEAKRLARLQFGNPAVQAERTREVNVANWADALLRDLRHSSRAMIRKPGFTATVVITLAVCIGANTAVFSAIDSILLRPLPFPDGERLVLVRQVLDTETPIAPARLQDWTRLSSTFEALTGYYVEDVSDTTGALPERVRRATVASRFLEVWGIAPDRGRGFTEAESRLGGPPAVLISDRYWRNRLDADPNVLARSVRIEGRPYSIVGVMLGLRLSWEDASLTGRIVGVVADARELGMDRDPGPTVYACDSASTPFPWFLVRTQGDPLALAGAVRLKLKDLEPLRSVYDIAPLEQRIGDAYEQSRLRTMLLVLFAATALFLACLGLYGTLSYVVSLRRREVGLRLALGALRSEIIGATLGPPLDNRRGP